MVLETLMEKNSQRYEKDYRNQQRILRHPQTNTRKWKKEPGNNQNYLNPVGPGPTEERSQKRRAI